MTPVVLAIAFFFLEAMESSRCSSLFMAAEFSLYRSALKITLAWGFWPSCDIVLPQRLVLARGSDEIVIELFLCSLLTIVLSIFPLAVGGIRLDV